jgi:phenylacetate-CoA ligase
MAVVKHSASAPDQGLLSFSDDCAWPAMPSRQGANLLSLLYQLERTQWWTPGRLFQSQLSQLDGLTRHAVDTVPFYRARFGSLGFRPDLKLTAEQWTSLPVLSRRDIQNAGEDLWSVRIPPEHGAAATTQTSGSTGEPVKVRKTALDQLFWQAMTMRDHYWHRRDFSGKLASIRVFMSGAGAPPEGTLRDGWGTPVGLLHATGPMALLRLNTDIAVQAEWLLAQDPDYLVTYPTNLTALIAHLEQRGARPRSLREVRTVGEIVSPRLRKRCQEAWGVPIVDIYSSQELGCIALQCPQSGQFHAMSESVLVEILRSDGTPCSPGEVGRLVISTLHNFAMPLIRYEVGDYAEVGAPCPCGRGLPAIARVLGRSRNLVTLPSGARHWPLVGSSEFRDIAPIRQFQLVQHTLEEIEVRLAMPRQLTGDEEQRIGVVIRNWIGYPFRLRFSYFADEIPRGPAGKYEEFISLLEQ